MNIKYNKVPMAIIILAIVMMIPFLGLSDFKHQGRTSRGGSCLHHAGTWQLDLPINNGGDIPYKPPFFHWCIAFFSLFPIGRRMSTPRLPSAVSLVLMTIGGFMFYAKRRDTDQSHHSHHSLTG